MNKRLENLLQTIKQQANNGVRIWQTVANALDCYIEFENAKDEVNDGCVHFIDNHSNSEMIFSASYDAVQQLMEVKKSQQEMSNIQIQKKEEDLNMKYLTKRKDGRWQGSRIIDGTRRYCYGRTQLECNEKLKKLQKTQHNTHSKQISFYKFAIWWLDNFKKIEISQKTYRCYKNAIEKHLNINTKINQVSIMQLQEIINTLPAGRIKQEVYRLACTVMKKAYELDFIKKDISSFLVAGKSVKANRRALTIEEQQALMNTLADDMFSRRVIFYLCTGVRPNEVVTVKKSEIRPGWIKVNGTKTQASVRWVKVSQKLTTMLLGESPEFFKFNDKRFREHLQRVCKQAGIDYDVSTYTLRHTFATNLYILRVPEKDRQTYMGHTAGSTMTNDVYTTFTPDTKPEDIYNIYGEWYPEF